MSAATQKILIADDDPGIRDALRMILEYDLYYVRNLSPALDILILLHTVKMAFF